MSGCLKIPEMERTRVKLDEGQFETEGRVYNFEYYIEKYGEYEDHILIYDKGEIHKDRIEDCIIEWMERLENGYRSKRIEKGISEDVEVWFPSI